MSQSPNRRNSAARRRDVLFAVALLSLAVLGATNGAFARTDRTTILPLWAQMALLAAGLVLSAAGLAVGKKPVVVPPCGGVELAGIGLVSVAACALRMWHLDGLRILVDEGNSIDSLFQARRTGAALLLPPNQYVTTLLYPYWSSLSVAAGGATLTGLRLSSAIIGALTVPALWFLTRALFDRVTALCAAIMLTALPVHLHFSRIALPHVMDALFGTLACACTAWALRGAGRRLWGIAGVLLALTHYGFEAGRWFYTPLLTTWLIAVGLFAPDRRPARADVALLALGFVVVVAPLYGAVLGAGLDLAPRLRSASVGADHLSDLPQRLWRSIGVYLWQPERAQFYGGDQALVPPLLAPFALIGLALALARHARRRVLVPLWLAAAWLANAALRESDAFPRWVVVMPALALVIAAGLTTVTAWCGRFATPTALLLSLALAAWHIHYYFTAHIDRLTVQALAAKPYRDTVDAVLRAVPVLRHGMIVVISEPVVDVHPPRSLLRLLRDGTEPIPLEALAPGDVDVAQLAALAGDRDVAFFFDPDDQRTPAQLACFKLQGPRPYTTAHLDNALAFYLAPAGAHRAACGAAHPTA